MALDLMTQHNRFFVTLKMYSCSYSHLFCNESVLIHVCILGQLSLCDLQFRLGHYTKITCWVVLGLAHVDNGFSNLSTLALFSKMLS